MTYHYLNEERVNEQCFRLLGSLQVEDLQPAKMGLQVAAWLSRQQTNFPTNYAFSANKLHRVLESHRGKILFLLSSSVQSNDLIIGTQANGTDSKSYAGIVKSACADSIIFLKDGLKSAAGIKKSAFAD